jgi:hypothetical protein
MMRLLHEHDEADAEGFGRLYERFKAFGKAFLPIYGTPLPSAEAVRSAGVLDKNGRSSRKKPSAGIVCSLLRPLRRQIESEPHGDQAKSEPVERAGARVLIVSHRPTIEAAVGIAVSLIHPYIGVGPQLVQVPDFPVSPLQRKAPLYTDDRSAPATRSKGCGDGADVAPVDSAVGYQGQDVTGQHVHPT